MVNVWNWFWASAVLCEKSAYLQAVLHFLRFRNIQKILRARSLIFSDSYSSFLTKRCVYYYFFIIFPNFEVSLLALHAVYPGQFWCYLTRFDKFDICRPLKKQKQISPEVKQIWVWRFCYSIEDKKCCILQLCTFKSLLTCFLFFL